MAIVWDVSQMGFLPGEAVESRAVVELDPNYPDKPPKITAGQEWFKGVLGGIRDEGSVAIVVLVVVCCCG